MRSTVILALVSIAIVLFLIGVTVGTISFQEVRITTLEITNTTTATQTDILFTTVEQQITEISTTTQENTFVSLSFVNATVPCPVTFPNGASPEAPPVISLQQNSTAYLCIRYYFYYPNSSSYYNVSSIFRIGAAGTFNASLSNASLSNSNFTARAFPENGYLFGGPQNFSEGESSLFLRG